MRQLDMLGVLSSRGCGTTRFLVLGCTLVAIGLVTLWPIAVRGSEKTTPRIWTDNMGRQVTAEFIRVHEENVILKLKGGVVKSIPLENFSETDQRYIYDLIGEEFPEDEEEAGPGPRGMVGSPGTQGAVPGGAGAGQNGPPGVNPASGFPDTPQGLPGGFPSGLQGFAPNGAGGVVPHPGFPGNGGGVPGGQMNNGAGLHGGAYPPSMPGGMPTPTPAPQQHGGSPFDRSRHPGAGAHGDRMNLGPVASDPRFSRPPFESDRRTPFGSTDPRWDSKTPDTPPFRKIGLVSLLLALVGVLTILAGWGVMIVKAFESSVLLGLAALFLPLVGFVLVVRDAEGARLLYLLGFVLMFLSYAVNSAVGL